MPENHIYAMDILEDVNRNTENQGDFFKRRFFSQPIKTGLTQKFLIDIVTPESALASANTPQGQADLVSLGAFDTIKAEVITIFEETAFSIIATQLRGAGSSEALTKQEILDYAQINQMGRAQRAEGLYCAQLVREGQVVAKNKAGQVVPGGVKLWKTPGTGGTGDPIVTITAGWNLLGNPVADVRAAKLLQASSHGQAPDTLVLATDSAAAFLGNSHVKDSINIQNNLGAGKFSLGDGTDGIDKNISHIGNWLGMEVYECNDVARMPLGTAVMGCSGAGRMGYGMNDAYDPVSQRSYQVAEARVIYSAGTGNPPQDSVFLRTKPIPILTWKWDFVSFVGIVETVSPPTGG